MPFVYLVHPVGCAFFKLGITASWADRVSHYKTAYPRFNHFVFSFQKPRSIEKKLMDELVVRECLWKHESGVHAETAFVGENNEHLMFALGFLYSMQQLEHTDLPSVEVEEETEIAPVEAHQSTYDGEDKPTDETMSENDKLLSIASEMSLAKFMRNIIDPERNLYIFADSKWYHRSSPNEDDKWTELDKPVFHFASLIQDKVEPLLSTSPFTHASRRFGSQTSRKGIVRELAVMCRGAKPACNRTVFSPSSTRLFEFLENIDEVAEIGFSEGECMWLEDFVAIYKRHTGDKLGDKVLTKLVKNEKDIIAMFGLEISEKPKHVCRSCKRKFVAGCCNEYSRDNTTKKVVIENLTYCL